MAAPNPYPSPNPSPSPSPFPQGSPPTTSSASNRRQSTGGGDKKGRMVGDYIVTSRIGSGSFASVWKATHKETNAEVAIKSINTEKITVNEKHQKNLESEIAIMKRLQHVNIVSLYDIMTTEHHIYLILELCPGGDLWKYIRKHGPMPIEVARHMMLQLAAGLQFMREHNLIHRDLKPQNLLLDSDSPKATLKIADFGFARYMQPQTLAATLCGSPLYMAPEILRYEKYDEKADLWSVGTILYEMLIGRPPFEGKNHIQLLQRIETTELSFPPAISLPEDCVHLLRGLLKRNPAHRMTFKEFFNHPFLQNKVAPPHTANTSLNILQNSHSAPKSNDTKTRLPNSSTNKTATGGTNVASNNNSNFSSPQDPNNNNNNTPSTRDKPVTPPTPMDPSTNHTAILAVPLPSSSSPAHVPVTPTGVRNTVPVQEIGQTASPSGPQITPTKPAAAVVTTNISNTPSSNTPQALQRPRSNSQASSDVNNDIYAAAFTPPSKAQLESYPNGSDRRNSRGRRAQSDSPTKPLPQSNTETSPFAHLPPPIPINSPSGSGLLGSSSANATKPEKSVDMKEYVFVPDYEEVNANGSVTNAEASTRHNASPPRGQPPKSGATGTGPGQQPWTNVGAQGPNLNLNPIPNSNPTPTPEAPSEGSPMVFGNDAEAFDSFSSMNKRAMVVARLGDENAMQEDKMGQATVLYIKALDLFYETIQNIQNYHANRATSSNNNNPNPPSATGYDADAYQDQLQHSPSQPQRTHASKQIENILQYAVGAFQTYFKRLKRAQEQLELNSNNPLTSVTLSPNFKEVRPELAGSQPQHYSPVVAPIRQSASVPRSASVTSNISSLVNPSSTMPNLNLRAINPLTHLTSPSPAVVSVCAEKLLYDWGLQLAKDAAIDEIMGLAANALKKYKRAYRVFDQLSVEREAREEDRVVLHHYMSGFFARIEAIKKQLGLAY